jgi:uncharacterized membrane protein YedE/YeeE
MEAFSPVPALIGGLMIGLASALLWIGNGRIAGISGIFGQLLPPNGSMIWRFVFLAALVSGAWVTAQFVPGLGVGGPGGEPARLVTAPDGWGIATPLWIALGGLLIGLGTKIGNGCTSGHGICGLARLSLRSFVAVGIFFGVAVITVIATGVAT